MDLELQKQWLIQQRDLFGNSLYLDEFNQVQYQNEIIGLDEFYKQIKNCQNCSLGSTRTNFIFGIGNPDADFVFIGEAPGEAEDIKGEPFVGKSGELFDKIISAIDLDRSKVYLLYVLKCSPPKNRNPQQNEVDQCNPYLNIQLKIINPKLIISLGKIPAQLLLNNEMPYSKLRNQIFIYEGFDMMITYHPAEILDNSKLKRPVWEDFKKIKENYMTGPIS